MNLEPIREVVALGDKLPPEPHFTAECMQFYLTCRARLPALPQLLEAVTWIKCSERMPEPYTRVLMHMRSGITSTGHLGSGSEGWRPDADGGNTDVEVTAWLPLSPPEDK